MTDSGLIQTTFHNDRECYRIYLKKREKGLRQRCGKGM